MNKEDSNNVMGDFAEASNTIRQNLRELTDTLKIQAIKTGNAVQGESTSTREVLAIFSTSELKAEIKARQRERKIEPLYMVKKRQQKGGK